MRILTRLPPNLVFYSMSLLVTQCTGLLLSFAICFVLRDFSGVFMRVAFINSLLLGLSLVIGCHITNTLYTRISVPFIAALSMLTVVGVSIISFVVVLVLEPTVFVYYFRGAISFLLINLLFILSFHVIGSGLIIGRHAIIAKERAIALEKDLRTHTETRLLSSRMNPHFLFNTLNMILNLLKDPPKAEYALLNLSDLLRENLERSDHATISVADEISNAKKYLELQQLRFGDRLQFSLHGEEIDFPIPPLIIQPLVENSIKHNMQHVPTLRVEIVLSKGDTRNIITVADSCRAVTEEMLNQGQGLTLTKKRIENFGGTFAFKNGLIEMAFPL